MISFLKISFFILISFFSGSVFADTYPVVLGDSTSAFTSCNSVANAHTTAWWGGTPVCTVFGSNVPKNWVAVFVGTQDYSNQGVWTIPYTCPYGGSINGSNCINAPACPTGSVRNSIGQCEFTCWDGSKTTDLTFCPTSVTCWDGSKAATLAQCPVHTCPYVVHGSMITTQTWNGTACVASDIKYCDLQLQIPDVVSGNCLPKPGATDCGNGIVVVSPVTCPVPHDHSQDITCPNGLIITPPRTCSVLPPDPSTCPGGASGVQTTGYVNGVPTCILKDGTTQPASASAPQTPPTGYNPQAYNPSVACNSNYSYPCNPSLPVVDLPGVSGIANCGPRTFFTCAESFTPPVVPPVYTPSAPATPQTTTGTSTTTATTTNTTTGSTTTSTTINSTTISGTGSVDCPTCAKESTQLHISDQLMGLTNGTGHSLVAKIGSDTFDNALPDAAVVAVKQAYSDKFAQVQSSIKSMFSFSGSGGGALPSFDFGVIKGVHVQADLSHYSAQLSYVGLTIMFIAAFLAVSILLG